MLELRDHLTGTSHQVIARRRPGNKGRRYPADPPRVEEIVAVMRQAGTDLYGRRLRGLIVVRWRAGLRISEALALRPAYGGVSLHTSCATPALSKWPGRASR